MNKTYESVKEFMEKKGGIVSAKSLYEIGISRQQLSRGVDEGWLIKESHGNYAYVDDYPDEYKIIQNRSDKIIYSFGTALYLHGLSDRVPHELDITVPQGDNVSRISKFYDNLKFHYCKKDVWDLGITEVTTPQGYKVKTYDKERCICDLIKNRKSVDAQLYRQALNEYFSGECDKRKLIKYAKVLNIESKVRMYMEVL